MSADISALINPLQPFAQALVDLAGRAGVNPRITSTLRTRSQQERLYRAYLRGENRYPVAPPGTSSHEYGFAFDMVAGQREDLHDLGTVWTQWGGVWSASDEVHFEFPGFVAPPLAVQAETPNVFLKACDFLAGFTPYGAFQLADSLAEIVAPLHCDDPRYGDVQRLECTIQRLIQGPCSQLLRGS